MRQWIAVGVAVGLVGVSLPYVREHTADLGPSLQKTTVAPGGPTVTRLVTPPPLARLDLTDIDASGEIATAPAHGTRIAELTIVPKYQRAARRMLRDGDLPEGSIVMNDVRTGEVLVWANYSDGGELRDFASEATAPAASIFKIVTGAALVEAGVMPSSKHCYRGGKSKLTAADLVPDDRRDKWCATLSEAMGRSINTIFARNALQHLNKEREEQVARRLGWDQVPPFDVPIAPSRIDIPDEPFEFAKTAAGFWNTTLSPFHGAFVSTTIANEGEAIRLHIVRSVRDDDGELYRGPVERQPLGRVLDPATARAVTAMLDSTVHNGTGYQAFHDRSGRSFLPGIRVAGKTGTLQRPKPEGPLYTWFVGFAPSEAPEVAISVLAANRPEWKVKATTLAAKMLRVYFADQEREGVRDPYARRAQQ